MALVHLGLGDRPRALDDLEQALAADSQMMAWLGQDRVFDPLRSEPRFVALLEETCVESLNRAQQATWTDAPLFAGITDDNQRREMPSRLTFAVAGFSFHRPARGSAPTTGDREQPAGLLDHRVRQHASRPGGRSCLDLQAASHATEIYLQSDGDGGTHAASPRTARCDGFPALSPDGRRVALRQQPASRQRRAFGTSDPFSSINADGTGETWLARGSSATWLPDGRFVAYHASASGSGRPDQDDPGAGHGRQRHLRADVDGRGERRNLTEHSASIRRRPRFGSPDGKAILVRQPAVTDDANNS